MQKNINSDVMANNAELHDEMENVSTNNSENETFSEVAKANMSRRKVLAGGVTLAATSFLAPQAMAFGHGWGWGHRPKRRPRRELVDFQPVEIADVVDTSMPTISPDYQYQVLIPWGTPIEPGATSEYTGDPSTRPTPEEAALQTGLGHDGMWFFPIDQKKFIKWGIHGYRPSSHVGMLCINHEYGINPHALGKDLPESLEDVRLSQNIHGVSVVKIKKWGRNWHVVKSSAARRITVNTPVEFSGPAKDSELLQNVNGNTSLGTVNNCGSGPTPWGTYLTCEENFNGYFGYTDSSYVPTASQARYGFSATGFNYGWYIFDKRFDISDPEYANECNRFGWIVEIDPFDGTQTPVKRTAMGRFKHEAVAIATTDSGRAACYMGDDQRGDYCYKYISDRAWEQVVAEGKSPLDEGKLYVARFNADGTGDWLLLSMENPVLTPLFADQAELLINTRLAADAVGATKMDRPEWTTIGQEGDVYWTLTNNDRKDRVPPQGEVNAANPENPNTDGHIIRTVDSLSGDGDSFTWEFFILASSTRGTPGVFTDPDAAYADSFGRLFIGTDGSQPDGLQDQLVVFDTNKETPDPKRLLVGVSSDEITGFTITPDQRTAFVNIQHPGNGFPTSTNFPAPFDGVTIPRDCTLVITRKDGGIIGS